jgi:hypothetical protein
MAKRKPLDAAGWQSATSVYALLRDLQQHHGAGRTPSGRRRLRLFACAACRQAWQLCADDDSRRAVEVAERFADGSAGREELDSARRSAEAAERRLWSGAGGCGRPVPRGEVRHVGQTGPDVIPMCVLGAPACPPVA